MGFEDVIHPFLGRYMEAPQWVKSSVGLAYAMIPQRLRHGSAFPAFVKEAAERRSETIKKLAADKLRETLRWAIETVPAYRPYQHLLRLNIPVESWLERLPLTGKVDIKADTARYLSETMPAGARLPMFTGGSAANPMKFFLHKGVTRSKEAAYINAFDRRAGIQGGEVILALRGRSVPGAGEPGGRMWMYEPIKRHLILSSDHLEMRFMPEYVKALRQWKPCFIQAFPSAIYPLTRWFQENPAPDVTGRIRCIQLTSENVYEYQARALREVFGCPVLRHYGHSERVLMGASLPDDDRYFFWPLYGHLELVGADGQPIDKPGVLGEIVGTSFDNKVMPFVRYRTGDMAMWSARSHPELSGWPVLERIEGRLQEFIVCRDERLISVCTLGAAHFSQLADVEAIQYEQCKPGHLVLKIVSQVDLTPDMVRKVRAAVIEKTQGGCDVAISRVQSIPRTGRGKQQMLIQHLDISGYLGAACIENAGA